MYCISPPYLLHNVDGELQILSLQVGDHVGQSHPQLGLSVPVRVDNSHVGPGLAVRGFVVAPFLHVAQPRLYYIQRNVLLRQVVPYTCER